MCIPKKHIPPIRLVRKGHFLTQVRSFVLVHLRQREFVAAVERVVVESKGDDDEAEGGEGGDYADLFMEGEGCFLIYVFGIGKEGIWDG